MFNGLAESGVQTGFESSTSRTTFKPILGADMTALTGGGTLTGTGYADTIRGGAGNDTLIGGAGNDTITTGTGTDTVDGGAGDDTITAGGGTATIDGGAGADTITGSSGVDVITGGAGNDTIDISSGGVDVIIGGLAGTSTVKSGVSIAGANLAANDTITFTNGIDTITGFGSTDLIQKAAANNTDVAALTNLVGVGKTAALNDADGAYVVYGVMSSSNVFTVEADYHASTGNDALVVFGIDSTNLTMQTHTGYMLLQDLGAALATTNLHQATA